MKRQQAVKVLSEFNKWRRGRKMAQPNPKQIGEAIDVAIKALRELNR